MNFRVHFLIKVLPLTKTINRADKKLKNSFKIKLIKNCLEKSCTPSLIFTNISNRKIQFQKDLNYFQRKVKIHFWSVVRMPNLKFKSWTESIKQVPELVYLHGRSQREIMTQEHRMQDDVQFNLCTDWNRSTARAVLQSYTELL